MIDEVNSYWQNITCAGRIWLPLAEHDLYWLIVTLAGRICSQSKVFCCSALLCSADSIYPFPAHVRISSRIVSYDPPCTSDGGAVSIELRFRVRQELLVRRSIRRRLEWRSSGALHHLPPPTNALSLCMMTRRPRLGWLQQPVMRGAAEMFYSNMFAFEPHLYAHTHTHTHTPVWRPFVRDYPGKPVTKR